MASRRVIYTLLEPVTRPYFAPYRHNYNQRQQQKKQQALQRRWIANGNGVQEFTEEELNGLNGGGTGVVTSNVVTSNHNHLEDNIESSSHLVEHNQEVPWYLRNNDTIKANETLQSREPLPNFPPLSPKSLENISKFMIEDLGLVDLQIIDLRNLQPASPFGPNAIMLLCSGKSSRHLNKAGQNLIAFVKENYNKFAETEGILSSNFLKVYNRRLRKRAQRQGTVNREFMTGSENGTMIDRTGSWVILDTKVDGIYIHLFNEDRRSEVDLEGFWNKRIRDGGVSDLIDLPQSKFEKRFVLPGSRRNFSTSVIVKIGNVRNVTGGDDGANARINSINIGSKSTAYSTTTNGNIPLTSASNSAITDELSSSESQNFLSEINQWSLLGDYRRCIRLSSFSPDNLTSEESQKAHTLILKAHINNLSIKQKEDLTKDITPTSDIITSFINSIPTNPTPLQWRLRLIFLQKLHAINEKLFPLNLLVEHVILQQASGIPIESWDVEMIVATIAYSNQFNNQYINTQSLKEWELVCNEKLKLLLQVHEIAFRSTGEILSTSDSLLKLLYRLCFSGAKSQSILPQETSTNTALKPRTKGSNVTNKRAFIDSRSSTILGLFGGEGGVKMTKSLVILIMTVLINDGSWNKFWSVWNNINRYTIVDQDLLQIMVSLVTKTADYANISYMLERYLPNLLNTLSRHEIQLLPETIEKLNESLQYLDPVNGRYQVLRAYLGNETTVNSHL